jgi:predicted N-acetyltransferase YhbS
VRQIIQPENRARVPVGRGCPAKAQRRIRATASPARSAYRRISRITVVCDAETGAIVGYVTLSAGHIEREHLPKSAQCNRPEHLPIFLLGQLAVDRKVRGNGYARSLLLIVRIKDLEHNGFGENTL